MDDFTLNDLAAIERERDLPPDQPPYDWGAGYQPWDNDEEDDNA